MTQLNPMKSNQFWLLGIATGLTTLHFTLVSRSNNNNLFMQRMEKGKCVIVVISDRYLKSPNCMYELVQIVNNGEFDNRIFPMIKLAKQRPNLNSWDSLGEFSGARLCAPTNGF